jgi:Immunoglobulin I-set domain
MIDRLSVKGSQSYTLIGYTISQSQLLLQVSWLRLRDPIPQLMSLNNMTNTLNSRFRALVTDWREFVLMVRDVKSEDAGQYECQV